MVGSLPYMAPEMDPKFVRVDKVGKALSPQKLTARPGFASSVDMWAFGVIVLELARGKLWRSDNKTFLCDLASRDPKWTCAALLEDLEPEMRSTVAFLIEPCLSRLPEDRPTAASLLSSPRFNLLVLDPADAADAAAAAAAPSSSVVSAALYSRKLVLEEAENASLVLALSCLNSEPFKFLLSEVPAVQRLSVLAKLIMEPQVRNLISSSCATGVFSGSKLLGVQGVSPSTSFPVLIGLKIMSLLRKEKHKRTVSKCLRYYAVWFKMIRSLAQEASRVKIYFGAANSKAVQDALLLPECDKADSEGSFIASVVSSEDLVRQLRDYQFSSISQFDTQCSICPIVRSLPPLYLCVRPPSNKEMSSLENYKKTFTSLDDSFAESWTSSSTGTVTTTTEEEEDDYGFLI